MSNARRAAAPPNSLERYRKDVAKETPFVLFLDDDKKLEIQRPTGKTVLALEHVTSSREGIELMCGDQADELLKVVEEEDFAIMAAILKDIASHFGLDEALGQKLVS